ncbi:hypothetical protein ACFE04_021849 [Oxalis oulophora]
MSGMFNETSMTFRMTVQMQGKRSSKGKKPLVDGNRVNHFIGGNSERSLPSHRKSMARQKQPNAIVGDRDSESVNLATLDLSYQLGNREEQLQISSPTASMIKRNNFSLKKCKNDGVVVNNSEFNGHI